MYIISEFFVLLIFKLTNFIKINFVKYFVAKKKSHLGAKMILSLYQQHVLIHSKVYRYNRAGKFYWSTLHGECYNLVEEETF